MIRVSGGLLGRSGRLGLVVRVSCVVGVAATLAACQSVRETLSGDNAIDYQSVVRTDPLSIPPDLTQAAADPRFRAPATGITTYSQFQSQSNAQGVDTRGSSGLTQVAVLPSYPGIEVKRDGDLRWLVIDSPPEVLYPKVSEFWFENGFSLEVNDPKAGIMITNWAENRAKIPESWLRQLLGAVLETAYDSGERDKFRTIFERDGNKTTVSITHSHMVEVLSGVDQSTVTWEHGREDPGLNAAMLARLMVYLGESSEDAKRKMVQAQEEQLRPTIQNQIGPDGLLVIDEGFDQSWRRVGLALDSGNFAVEDRDRSAGDFFVRYVDTDTGVKREDPSFFAKLFGAKAPLPAQMYRLNLKAEGDRTVVRVYDDNGVQDTTDTGKRILTVLAERL